MQHRFRLHRLLTSLTPPPRTFSALCAIFFFFIFLVTHCVSADDLQSTTSDESARADAGKPYSVNEPLSHPSVSHEDFDKRIETLRKQTPVTCLQHGDIDCTRGPDQDGSVICLDGFRDSVVPFRLHCLEAKLQLQTLLLISPDEQIPWSRTLQSLPNRFSSLQLSIRNTSDIPAREIEVSFIFPVTRPVSAVGPTTLAPYESADFSLPLNVISRALNLRDIQELEYRVRCKNCGPIRSRLR